MTTYELMRCVAAARRTGATVTLDELGVLIAIPASDAPDVLERLSWEQLCGDDPHLFRDAILHGLKRAGRLANWSTEIDALIFAVVEERPWEKANPSGVGRPVALQWPRRLGTRRGEKAR